MMTARKWDRIVNLFTTLSQKAPTKQFGPKKRRYSGRPLYVANGKEHFATHQSRGDSRVDVAVYEHQIRLAFLYKGFESLHDSCGLLRLAAGADR